MKKIIELIDTTNKDYSANRLKSWPRLDYHLEDKGDKLKYSMFETGSLITIKASHPHTLLIGLLRAIEGVRTGYLTENFGCHHLEYLLRPIWHEGEVDDQCFQNIISQGFNAIVIPEEQAVCRNTLSKWGIKLFRNSVGSGSDGVFWKSQVQFGGPWEHSLTLPELILREVQTLETKLNGKTLLFHLSEKQGIPRVINYLCDRVGPQTILVFSGSQYIETLRKRHEPCRTPIMPMKADANPFGPMHHNKNYQVAGILCVISTNL